LRRVGWSVAWDGDVRVGKEGLSVGCVEEAGRRKRKRKGREEGGERRGR